MSEVTQSCPTLQDPMDCSLPGSSVQGIFQARILEWVAISFSRGSSRPRGRTQVSHIVGRRFTVWATREDQAQWPLLTHQARSYSRDFTFALTFAWKILKKKKKNFTGFSHIIQISLCSNVTRSLSTYLNHSDILYHPTLLYLFSFTF